MLEIIFPKLNDPIIKSPFGGGLIIHDSFSSADTLHEIAERVFINAPKAVVICGYGRNRLLDIIIELHPDMSYYTNFTTDEPISRSVYFCESIGAKIIGYMCEDQSLSSADFLDFALN
jgi:hypothetical protein